MMPRWLRLAPEAEKALDDFELPDVGAGEVRSMAEADALATGALDRLQESFGLSPQELRHIFRRRVGRELSRLALLARGAGVRKDEWDDEAQTAWGTDEKPAWAGE